MTESSGTGTGKLPAFTAEALVPVLAFGGTVLGIALHNAGMQFPIQFAATGGFAASCLLAYRAWTRADREIVSLSTPIYGFIFLVTPFEYTAGVAIQLVYAAGLTILAARLRTRLNPGGLPAPATVSGDLAAYLGSVSGPLGSLGPATGSRAADVFLCFSAGDYGAAADHAQAAAVLEGLPSVLARGFSILHEQAGLMDRNGERPFIFRKFSLEDAPLLALPLPGTGNADREFEAMLDNGLLLLYAAGWHASPADRDALVSSKGFAERLIGQDRK